MTREHRSKTVSKPRIVEKGETVELRSDEETAWLESDSVVVLEDWL